MISRLRNLTQKENNQVTNDLRHSSSFRDPSGYIFVKNHELFRVINPIYFKQYNILTESGFFDTLSQNNLLIKHEEVSRNVDEIIIKPQQIPFITYPYEWSFEQYKEAALLTLKLQKYALVKGFCLKDASAFNVTFFKGKAVFIDTLSFDFYEEGKPWRGYKQFIMHFLGPLVLAHYHGNDMLKFMQQHIDGVPVKMIASMLPYKTKFSPILYTNIHLLAKFEDKHNEDMLKDSRVSKLSKKGQIKIIETLYDFISKLGVENESEWSDYYYKMNYSDIAFENKALIIKKWVEKLDVKKLIDVGGNNGHFVRTLEERLEAALVCDIDSNAVDSNYKMVTDKEETYILPFVLDVLSPSPAIGFKNKERLSFIERVQQFQPDITFALALIHHISLSGNVPFDLSAKFFASFSKYLIIEFPKREDSWVKKILQNKGDFENHFGFYNIENFEKCYAECFELKEKIAVEGSQRILYLYKNRDR